MMNGRIALLAMVATLGMGCTVTPGTAIVEVSVCSGDIGDEAYKVTRSGRVFAGPCTELYQLPLREQRAVWTKSSSEGSTFDESITFAGKDGQPLNVDLGIAYSISDNDEDVIRMIRTYGPDLHRTIDSRVRDAVRDGMNACSSDFTVQEIYGTKKIDVVQCAEARVQQEFKENGLVINRITLNSEVRMPPALRDAMVAAQQATQEADKVRREVELTEAEARKQIVSAKADAEAMQIRAEAEASYNRTISKSITKETLELQRLEIERIRAERWDGTPTTTYMGAGAGGDVSYLFPLPARE